MSQPKREDIGKKLAKLAHHLADRVLTGDGEEPLTVAEEASIFNALRAYYAMTHRLAKEPGDGKGIFDGGWADSFAGNRTAARGGDPDPGDTPLDF